MQTIIGGGGGGLNMVHYGHSENGEWQRLRAGKMKQILRSDLLLEQSRWPDLSRLEFPFLARV